jgi:hypothetical protein
MTSRLRKDEILASYSKTRLHQNAHQLPRTIPIKPYTKSRCGTRQKHFGDQCEAAFMNLGGCYLCGSRDLINMNSLETNYPGCDFKCFNCDANYQVKGFEDPDQLHVNRDRNLLELKQGGSYHIISPFTMDKVLIYVFVNYDAIQSKIKQIVFSSILKPCDVLGPCGQGKKCRILFREPCVLFFD